MGMKRWAWIAGVVWVCTTGSGALANPADWLLIGYSALGDADRRVVQQELALAGVYTGAVDGGVDGAIAQALAETPAFLERHTDDGITVPLDTAEDGARFVRELAAQEWSGFLYGTASENAVH